MKRASIPRSVIALTCGVGLFYLAFLPPTIYSIDGNSMFEVAVSVATKGSFAVSPSLVTVAGRDHQQYSKCWPLLSLLALVPVGASLEAARVVPVDPVVLARGAAVFFSPILTALSVGLVALVAMQLGGPPRYAMLAALCFAFGTIAIVYTRDFFAEPLLTFLTIWGVYLQLDASRTGRAIGVVSGLAVLAKPPGLILGPLFALHSALTRRKTSAFVLPVIGAVAGLVLYFLYNRARFGAVLSFGQPNRRFDIRTLPRGTLGLLLSPGRGVLWYSPTILAIAGMHRRLLRRPDVALLLAIAAGYFLQYAMWYGWSGGWCWGPRQLLPAFAVLMPLGALLALKWRRAMVVLAATGFAIAAPTLVSRYFNVFREQLAAGRNPYQLLWSVSQAPFIQVWRTAFEELGRAAFSAAPAGSAGLPIVEGVWWWNLPAIGISPWLGVAVSSVMVTLGVFLIVRAFRETDSPHASLVG
jgi:hypothetical protein